MKDLLKIGGKELSSRLFIGTGKYASNEIMAKSVAASKTEVVTVALRRADTAYPKENILNFIPKDCILMPNTSGARNAEEAVRIARMARAIGCGDWIKIEVIADQRYLLPDNEETVKATKILVQEGFTVLPYMCPDLMTAKRLVDVGAAAVMPLGAPIGSNQGLQTKALLQILLDEIDIPVIVDAGIGKPSEAAEAMQMGAAAVLVNTAIATAKNSILMAEAFNLAVEAGRLAYLGGMSAVLRQGGNASSPLTGFLHE